jgi:hypothetical protein
MVDKQGFNMLMAIPKDLTKVGYEDIDNKERWIITPIRGFINFNPQRREFYSRSWFPDGQEDLVTAYFRLQDPVTMHCLIRTRDFEIVSQYGDFVFSVAKIFDDGMFKVLKRTCFLRPVIDRQVYLGWGI